jgi:hypothetical protein
MRYVYSILWRQFQKAALGGTKRNFTKSIFLSRKCGILNVSELNGSTRPSSKDTSTPHFTRTHFHAGSGTQTHDPSESPKDLRASLFLLSFMCVMRA